MTTSITDTDGSATIGSGRASTTATSALTVADAPLSASGASTITGTEGATISNATTATFTDADPNGVVADYVASINWGDGTSSAGVISASGTSFVVKGSHAYTEEGSYTAVTTITDTDGGAIAPGRAQATASTAVNVADAPLSALSVPAIAFVEGTALTSITTATFTDADPNEVVGDYVASINWGDGSASNSMMIVKTGSGRPGEDARLLEEDYTITTQITDTDGAVIPINIRSTASAVAQANVSDAPLTPGTPAAVTGLEGNASSGVVVGVHRHRPEREHRRLRRHDQVGRRYVDVGHLRQGGEYDLDVQRHR